MDAPKTGCNTLWAMYLLRLCYCPKMGSEASSEGLICKISCGSLLPCLFSQQDAQFTIKMGHLDPYIHVDILANPYFVSRWRNGKNSAKNSNCCLLLICSSATQWDSGEVIPTPTPPWKHLRVQCNIQPRECATCGINWEGITHTQNWMLFKNSSKEHS